MYLNTVHEPIKILEVCLFWLESNQIQDNDRFLKLVECCKKVVPNISFGS